MFPREVPAQFEREHGCTEREWLANLPGAAGSHHLVIGDAAATVAIGAGALHLAWQVLPERRIGLARLPRLRVRFRFADLEADQRQAFMRHFDLTLQRGGG